jgi:hypothetical protein
MRARKALQWAGVIIFYSSKPIILPGWAWRINFLQVKQYACFTVSMSIWADNALPEFQRFTE